MFDTTADHFAGDRQFEAAERWIDQCDTAARRAEQAREEEERRLEEERRVRERAAEVRRQEEERRIREEAEEREREERHAREVERAARLARVEAERRRELEEELAQDREEERARAERLAMLEQERERSLAVFAERLDADMDDELAAPPIPIDVDAPEEGVPDQTGTNPGEEGPIDPNATFGTMFGLDGTRVGVVPLGEPVKVSGLVHFVSFRNANRRSVVRGLQAVQRDL
jgi:hypothetical protein